MHAALGKSDRGLIKFSFRCEPENLPNKTVCDYKKADYNEMRQKLHNIHWEDYLSVCDEDVDKIWEKFVAVYNEADQLCENS